MEFLDSSRSAKKYDPQRTARYRRADPRATNIILGYDSNNNWESTTKKTQRTVSEGTNKLGTMVTSDRSMTTARKRGMLSSSLSFGNEPTNYRTESKNYFTHDLKMWGPRTSLQKDSYSWTEKERTRLQSLRVKGNPVSGNPVKFDPYIKLPPITGPSTEGLGNNTQADRHQVVPNGTAGGSSAHGFVNNPNAGLGYGLYRHNM